MDKKSNDTRNLQDDARAAEALLREFRAGAADAIDRVHQHLPQVKFRERAAAAAFPLTLADAQTVIARENDAQSWGELRLRYKSRQGDIADELAQFKQLVYARDAEGLDALLNSQPLLLQTLDDPHFDFGSTALIIAKDDMAVVDVLLKHDADINAKSHWWAGDFHILEVASAETVQQLIARGAKINVHAAAEQGWLDWLDAAYFDDPFLAVRRGGDGKTPLHYATDPAVMDWLIERAADLEARDLDHESTPLQWQLGARNYQAARELVKRGAQVDIFAAVILGELALVERALAERPAAIRARVNNAGYDLAPKADGSHQYVYTFNAAGLSPHQVALEYGHAEIFDYLVEQSPPDVRLLAHCAAADEDAARRIVAERPGLVAEITEGDQRQLIYAAWTNQVAVVKLMAALGFDLHIYDDDRLMPLHSAAYHGFADVIAALLAADAEPPLTWLNGYGGTAFDDLPLRAAAQLARAMAISPASIKLLVEAGSEVRAEWLPSGDEMIDEVFRAALKAKD